MSLINELKSRYTKNDVPCLISQKTELYPKDLLYIDACLDAFIRPGDVVALIGEFDEPSIRKMLTIIDKKAIYMPLSAETSLLHNYFFECGMVDVVVSPQGMKRLRKQHAKSPLLQKLRSAGQAGLILFSSGTTGMPKAILHNFDNFLKRFRTPRKAFRTLNFLLFDHIGGINTMLHTLFNQGVVIMPSGRRVTNILSDIENFKVEVLPTTPTFLRMMLFDGSLEMANLSSLKLITYGTERMDEISLQRICSALPHVDFRQTFGMSELGILRVKSVSRDSLWMHIGGEGIETRVDEGVLKIKSSTRMLGYLNAPSPFDREGWYNTNDIVKCRKDGAIRVIGRTTEWINIGGEKVLPEVLENAALKHESIIFAQAKGVANPITGMHAELTCQLKEGTELTRQELKKWLKQHLPQTFMPQRIRISTISINHRFKKMG